MSGKARESGPSIAPEEATPPGGGAYLFDPATGRYTRDGRTEQTKDSARLAVRPNVEDPEPLAPAPAPEVDK